MSWNLSTGMRDALLAAKPTVSLNVTGTTISFGDGDGAGGTDTINDTANGLDVFKQHQFILISNGGANNNQLVKALTVAAGKIEVPAGSLTAVAAGASVTLLALDGMGSVAALLQNSVIDIYSGGRPANADALESGTKLLTITLNGGIFVPGEPTNGINLGNIVAGVLKRAIDPETGVVEIWRGVGLVDGTAGWARWYANDKTTGASTTAIRMDGVVSTSGGDINMVNGTEIRATVGSEFSDVSVTMSTN